MIGERVKINNQWSVPNIKKRTITGVTKRTAQFLIINLSLMRLLPKIIIAF